MTPCALKHRIRPSAVFIMLRVLVQYLVGRFPNARGARNPNFVHHHTLSLPAMQPTTTRTITPRPFEARSSYRSAAERRIGSTTPSPGGAGRAPPSCWEPTTSDTKIAASFRVSPTALRRRDRVSRFGSSGQSLWGASQGRERNVVLGLAHGRSRFAPRSGAGAGSRDREVRRVGDQPIPRRDKVYHSSCRQDGRPHDR